MGHQVSSKIELVGKGKEQNNVTVCLKNPLNFTSNENTIYYINFNNFIIETLNRQFLEPVLKKNPFFMVKTYCRVFT